MHGVRPVAGAVVALMAACQTQQTPQQMQARMDKESDALKQTLAAIGKMLSFSPDSTNSGRGAMSPAMSCISAQFRIPGT